MYLETSLNAMTWLLAVGTEELGLLTLWFPLVVGQIVLPFLDGCGGEVLGSERNSIAGNA